ncbi:MAG: DegT/DnrJ/EryC1/StrS family aminotransferase [Bacteroidia bacterium]
MNFIPLIRPSIIKADIKAVAEVLASGMLVQGINVETFEKRIADLIGVKHVIAASNGTATLHLILHALGIGEGDEVIVPAFSYVATANVVELVGATPVFIDVKLPDCNINIDLIEKAITPKTKAIIPVHEFGLACDINELMQIATRHNLFVIEDAACALGSKINDQPVGSFGIAGSFSFHPRKSITAGEGGVITTNDDALAGKLRLLRNHGQTITDGKMDFTEAGFNYRLTDFQAAFVNSQLSRLDKNIAVKSRVAKKYLKEFKGNKNLLLPKNSKNKFHTWQTFHVIADESIDRDALIQKLKEKNIGTNYGAQCIPFMKFYSDKYQLDCNGLFPNAMRAYLHGLAVPVYERLKKEEVSYIIETLNELTSNK